MTWFYDLVKDHLPITGPYRKKFTFNQGKKLDNDDSSLTFSISRHLTSSLSSTSEYNKTSTSIKDYDNNSD